MRKWYLPGMLVCLLTAAVATAFAQTKPAPTVTLSVTDKPAAEVAAELSKQLGFTVAIVEPCAAKVTLELKDAKAEEAIAAFAKAFDATWLRSYFLQPKEANYVYKPDQYLTGLTTQRQAWMDSYTDEERQALFQSWFGNRGFGGRGGPGGGPGGQGQPGAAPAAPDAAQPAAVQPLYTREQMAAMPGAGRSTLGRRGGPGGPGGGPGGQGQPGQAGAGQPPAAGQPAAAAQPAAEGQPAAGQPAQGGQPGGQGGPGGQRQQWSDPVADLIIPVRVETVTLKEDNADLQQTLLGFTDASGFIAVASTDLTGAVTCALDKTPINDVLDKVAAAVNAKWQPLYLLSLPRVLSEAEVEARQEARFQGQWGAYWAKPVDERKKDLQNRIDMINRMAERAKQMAQNGQPNGGGGRMQRMGARIMSRMERYSATLSMEQRREIMPLVRALGAALNDR